MTTFETRLAALSAASLRMRDREAAALATISEDDRWLAQAISTENARDTTSLAERTFAYRLVYLSTLEMVCDDAASYDIRRS